ncbi:type I-E CRISPR-associated protein Cse2/CasB [Nocardiopsis sp. CC223A]|uniref:type I-E CRISPR-associated protein Cse2/CasB n=1 Tax=Nocardiopsis sp. CC223A TaxID=3044051 RepID=UPI00278BC9CA|nr:type I-E CRISPR-associated protein Cse2/CasB [Nocardiopsis sp. CC223A]
MTEGTTVAVGPPFSRGAPENGRLARLFSGLWDGRELAHEAPATLSRWRKGLGRSHEESPFLSLEIAEVLQDRADAPHAVQSAVFHTLTLYSAHQQSVSSPMHVNSRNRHSEGTSVGHAMRDLCAHNAPGMTDPWNHKDNKGIVRLMEAVVTAHSVPELVGHLRHVVSLLRKTSIALDYVRLARDVHAWSTPWRGRAANRWAMDFYVPVTTKNDDNADTTDEEH